jgi:hypothetical protein
MLIQGRLSRLPGLHVLLVALAVQAITPDAQDLASIHSLRLFAPSLIDLETPPQQDEWPDDVCDPLDCASSVRLTPSQSQVCPSAFGVAIIQAQLCEATLDCARISACRGMFTSHMDLICSLGRLTC